MGGYIALTWERYQEGNLLLFVIIPAVSVALMGGYSIYMIFRAMHSAMVVILDRQDKVVGVYLMRWNRVRASNRVPLAQLARVRVSNPSRKRKRSRLKAGLDPKRWYVSLETRAGGSVGVINTYASKKAEKVGKKLSQALGAPLFVR